MKKCIFLGFLFMVIIVSCSSKKTSTPPSPIDPNPIPPTTINAKEIVSFKFNESNGETTNESKTGSNLTINVPSGAAERIVGIEGNAIVVNGFYGWASGKINVTYPTSNVAITGWVAPSAFPVQRKDADPITENTVASIFSNVNPSTGAGVALGVDQYGRIIGQCMVGSTLSQIVSDVQIPLKKWSFITMNVTGTNGKAELYLNGDLVQTKTFTGGSLVWDNSASVFIGKESKVKTIAGFDTNGLTGAIDKVSVWDNILTTNEIKSQFSTVNVPTPNLSIPIEERYKNDKHRPKYHLAPSAGWTNESHGLFYLQGKYHLFSQRNFNGPYLEHINWGHYVSTDLVNWEEKQQVLWPQPGFDEVGIWSGHVVVTGDNPYLFYTGVNKAKAAIGLAKSNSPYDTWTKNTSPVITSAPTTGYTHADFRDPFVFEYNSNWYMMVGTGLRNGTARGGLFLYKSALPDFTKWDLQGTMLEGSPSVDQTGEFWEMPIYYNFGSKSILLINKLPNANSLYWTGNFNGSKFIVDSQVPTSLELINQLLSPSIGKDANGNLTAIGIIPDNVTSAKHKSQGWANVFSLPRVWTLVNSKIKQVPHPNLLNLRSGQSTTYSNLSYDDSSTNILNGASGSQYEIVATTNPGTAAKVGFVLHKNTATTEQTLIYYDVVNKSFVVDRSKSSVLSDVPKTNQSTAYELPAGDIKWRIFVDASVVEVFINEELAFATRVFPSGIVNGIDLYAMGGTATASEIKIYNIKGGGVSSVAKMGTVKEDLLHPIIFPNPSNSLFNIQFENIKELSTIYAYVFDLNGFPVKKIETTVDNSNPTFYWDGFLDNGFKANQGVYIVKGFINNSLFEAKIILN